MVAMPVEQKEIYYATGENLTKISLLPQSERIREKGFDVLCMTDEVDEFAIKILREYEGKSFRSVTDAKMDIMDVQPGSIHERVSVVLGSKTEVEIAVKYHN